MTFLFSQFIILIGLVIFSYFSWRKIDYGIMVIIFLLPAYLLRLDIFGIPSTALESAIYILFIVWAAKNYLCVDSSSSSPFKREDKNEILYNKEGRKKIPPLIGGVRGGIIRQRLNLIKKEKTLIIGILLLLAGATISTIFSSDIRISAGILKGWFFDPFLFFIVLVSVIKEHKQAINVLKVFSISGFAVAAISLFYWFEVLSDGVSYDSRLHGFYSSPNYLAMYLAPALIIGVWAFLKYNFLLVSSSSALPLLISPSRVREGEKKNAGAFNLSAWKEKYFWFSSSIIIAAAIYLTHSYAAWFSLFIAIVFLFYFTAGIKKKPSFHWKLGFLSIFLIILLFTQIGTSKFENLKNLSYRSSANSRLMIWRSALAIGWDYPVFGIGPGNFQKFYLDYQKKFIEPYLEWAVPQPHNVFLAFWLETGILGLIGFILILAWFFRSGIHILKEPRLIGIQKLTVVLMAVMAYILLHGLFDATYWKNDLSMIFWLMVGLMAAIKK